MHKSLSVEPGWSGIVPPALIFGSYGTLSRRLPTVLALWPGDRYISAKFPDISRKGRADGPSVHLSHAGSVEDLSSQPQGARQHSFVVLPGRQDRRARRQRFGQVDA